VITQIRLCHPHTTPQFAENLIKLDQLITENDKKNEKSEDNEKGLIDNDGLQIQTHQI